LFISAHIGMFTEKLQLRKAYFSPRKFVPADSDPLIDQYRCVSIRAEIKIIRITQQAARGTVATHITVHTGRNAFNPAFHVPFDQVVDQVVADQGIFVVNIGTPEALRDGDKAIEL